MQHCSGIASASAILQVIKKKSLQISHLRSIKEEVKAVKPCFIVTCSVSQLPKSLSTKLALSLCCTPRLLIARVIFCSLRRKHDRPEDFQKLVENEYNCGELKQIRLVLLTAFTSPCCVITSLP